MTVNYQTENLSFKEKTLLEYHCTFYCKFIVVIDRRLNYTIECIIV